MGTGWALRSMDLPSAQTEATSLATLLLPYLPFKEAGYLQNLGGLFKLPNSILNKKMVFKGLWLYSKLILCL